jgi:SAM-dependent methyltransferase
MSEGYVYDQGWAEERARVAGMEALWDPGTEHVLAEAVHGRDHPRALLVGAGGGSIAGWLDDMDVRVLATDIDTRFLEPLAADSRIEVAKLDVTTDDLPGEAFDLVHARLVLEHLPGRDAVLARLAGALAPGGTLVVEDYDWTPFGFDPADEVDAAAIEGILGFMAAAGFDRTYGRRLTSSMAALGLEVRGEGRQLAIGASHPGFAFIRLSFDQLAPHAVEAGVLDAEVARIAHERLGDPDRRLLTPTLFAGIGTRVP